MGSVEHAGQRPSMASLTKRSSDSMSTQKRPEIGVRNFSRAPQRVRIIGGRWKRTPLTVLGVAGLRPTPNRVRETVFNWIGHLLSDLEARSGVDLFAGTGALGFELASRGARVTLVENNRQLLDQLTQTKRKLAADLVDIVAGDALSIAARWANERFDIVFIDPPFDSELHAPALAAAARLVTSDGLVYLERGEPVEQSALDQHHLQIERSARAGRVHFYLLRVCKIVLSA